MELVREKAREACVAVPSILASVVPGKSGFGSLGGNSGDFGNSLDHSLYAHLRLA